MKLWATSLERNLTEEENCALLAHLPPERQTRLKKRTDSAAWREPLCAYGLLRLALWETWGWRELPALALTERGKPVFSAYPTVTFNVSHTEGGVLVGLGRSPIGVDLERRRPANKRVQHRLEATGQTLEAYYNDWVRYEASVKQKGTGVRPHHDPAEGAELIQLLPGFSAAVCGEPVTELRQLTLEELLKGLEQL